MAKKTMTRARRTRSRSHKRPTKFVVPKDAVFDYKDLALIQKFVTDRGKLVPRRISGISNSQQMAVTIAVKRDRYLGLLPVGGVKKH